MSELPPIEPGRQPEEDALHHALGELRREIRGRFGGEPQEPLVAAPPGGTDWFALFDELRRRLATLGMEERSGEVDEFGMDEEALRRALPLLEFLRTRWWRVDVIGAEAMPTESPALFVANRAGLLPWDGLMIAHAVARAHPRGERPRFLVADWLYTLPFLQPGLARLGGVRACPENAARLLGHGRSVVAFPEGLKGAAKSFRDRYRVQRFGRAGAVRLALRAGVPIVPVAVVGSEETYPVLFRIGALARAVGLPFLPITPTFPWLGPAGLLPLPSKWSIHFGEPIATDALGPDAAEDALLTARLNEELRDQVQALLDADLHRRASIFSGGSLSKRPAGASGDDEERPV